MYVHWTLDIACIHKYFGNANIMDRNIIKLWGDEHWFKLLYKHIYLQCAKFTHEQWMIKWIFAESTQFIILLYFGEIAIDFRNA